MTTHRNDSRGQLEMLCSNCDEAQATLWCKKCENSYCTSCFELVHSSRVMKTHASMQIEERPLILPPCNYHPDEKLKFWCNYCMSSVCQDCILLQHQGHELLRITDVARQKVKEQKDLFTKAKLYLEQPKKHATEIMGSNETAVLESVTEVFDYIHSMISNYENDIKQKIRSVEKRNTDLIEQFQEYIKQKQNDLIKRTKEFEHTVACTNYIKILQDHQHTTGYLKRNIEESSKMKYPIKAEFRIYGLDVLHTAIAEMLQRVLVDEWQPVALRSSSTNIYMNAKWKHYGLPVAGGNGAGQGRNQLSKPTGLCVDDDGTVYIADCENHRIMEWKPGATMGQVVAGDSGKGNRDHQLNEPQDVILDKQRDALIIADYGNGRIVRWPRRNGTIGETIVSNIYCSGLTMDERGFLYAVDYGRHEVRRYRVGENKGKIVAGGNGKGCGLNQLSFPCYVFVDDDHAVYVSDRDNHRIVKWEEGAKQGVLVAGGQGQGNGLAQLSSPQGVIVDQQGTIYVADAHTNRIVRWHKQSLEGSVILGGHGVGDRPHQISHPVGLSFDRHGNLYVVEHENQRVQKYNIQVNI